MSNAQNRRESLRFLTAKFHSQNGLARQMKPDGILQPTISAILRSKEGRKYPQQLKSSEARYIEAKLKIPDLWMDQRGWVEEGWSLVERYRRLDHEARACVDGMLAFVRSRAPT